MPLLSSRKRDPGGQPDRLRKQGTVKLPSTRRTSPRSSLLATANAGADPSTLKSDRSRSPSAAKARLRIDSSRPESERRLATVKSQAR
jgi:hypothetical protein